LDALATPFMLETHEHQITASIGATLFSGTQKSIDDILKQADLAMYKAKDSGRNAMRFFDPLMQQLVVERSLNERAFRQAVAEQQFVLYYQPFVNADQRVMGVEALVRWNHPERGLVAPGEFITLAEETGLIVPLGSWVLESACQQIADWQHHPRLFEITVSVNVSAVQFRQEDFTAQVLATLERTAADPTRLKLELTESLLIDNVEDVIFKMNTLRAIGVQFSLDDFGTGYSSLAYLSRLPFDQVKIDRSFVRNIETNDDSVAICAAIVSLGHSLKLKVVAEGVETQAQRYFLSTVHKCDLLQGFLFSRPLAVVDFEEYAHTH
jgi:EAL domain-containing protein (putative c-di-GMP-specific phosphodiesterase class I)